MTCIPAPASRAVKFAVAVELTISPCSVSPTASTEFTNSPEAPDPTWATSSRETGELLESNGPMCPGHNSRGDILGDGQAGHVAQALRKRIDDGDVIQVCSAGIVHGDVEGDIGGRSTRTGKNGLVDLDAGQSLLLLYC